MTGGELFAVEVPDGGYVRVITAGPPDGLALVFHTGTPAGLLEYAALVDAAAANGLRVVMYGRDTSRSGLPCCHGVIGLNT